MTNEQQTQLELFLEGFLDSAQGRRDSVSVTVSKTDVPNRYEIYVDTDLEFNEIQRLRTSGLNIDMIGAEIRDNSAYTKLVLRNHSRLPRLTHKDV